MNAISPAHGGQPQIGQHKPLGRGWVIVRIGPRNAGLQRIDAWRQIVDDFAHRQAGGHVLIKRHFHFAGATPDFLGHLTREILELPLRQGTPEIVVLHRAQQIAVADTAQHQFQFGHIDGLNRNACISGFGQHIGAARKGHSRIAVINIERQFNRLEQSFTGCGRQPFAQHHVIAFAMFDARHAQTVIAGFDRQAIGGQTNVGGVIDDFVQRLGKLCADTRLGQIAFDIVFRYLQTVFVDGILQFLHYLFGRGNAFGQTQRL